MECSSILEGALLEISTRFGGSNGLAFNGSALSHAEDFPKNFKFLHKTL